LWALRSGPPSTAFARLFRLANRAVIARHRTASMLIQQRLRAIRAWRQQRRSSGVH